VEHLLWSHFGLEFLRKVLLSWSSTWLRVKHGEKSRAGNKKPVMVFAITGQQGSVVIF